MKKMYKQPETETLPMQTAGVLCASGESRVGVVHTPISSTIKIE